MQLSLVTDHHITSHHITSHHITHSTVLEPKRARN